MHIHLPKPLHGWREFVGEVGIVVLGIVIALGAEQVISHVHDRMKHRELLERLFEETEEDVATLRSMRDLLQGIVEREQAFSVMLAKGQCPAPADFQAVGTTTMMPALTAPTAVYQELMGAGGLSSIERKDVRNSLAAFHGDLEWGQKQVDYFRAVRDDPVPESDPRRRTTFDPNANEPQVDTYDTEALCRDQVFRNKMASATRNHTVFLTYFDNPLKDAIAVCLRLGDMLGDKCVPTMGGPLTKSDAAYAAKVAAKMRP